MPPVQNLPSPNLLQKQFAPHQLQAYAAGTVKWNGNLLTAPNNPMSAPSVSIALSQFKGLNFNTIGGIFISNLRCRVPVLVTAPDTGWSAIVPPLSMRDLSPQMSGERIVLSVPLGSMASDVTGYVLTDRPMHSPPSGYDDGNIGYSASSAGQLAASSFNGELALASGTTTIVGQDALITWLQLVLSGVAVSTSGLLTISIQPFSENGNILWQQSYELQTGQAIPLSIILDLKRKTNLFAPGGLNVIITNAAVITSGVLSYSGVAQ